MERIKYIKELKKTFEIVRKYSVDINAMMCGFNTIMTLVELATNENFLSQKEFYYNFIENALNDKWD